MKDLGPYTIDSIYCGECAGMMSRLPDSCIDLTVTSPEYDKLRSYKGFVSNWHEAIRQLYRVTAVGGVVVWVVADQTVNGSETGTSFKQALWAMECGFNLETMIYESDKQPLNHNRYEPKFEYMFIWIKGAPKTFNPIMEKSAYAGQKCKPNKYNVDGSKAEWTGNGVIKSEKVKGNIWRYGTGNGKTTKDKINHPGMFPEALARDHIVSWSNPGDLVLDPFMGSGTTAKMAIETGRDYLGFDISQEYVDLALRRVAGARRPLFDWTAA